MQAKITARNLPKFKPEERPLEIRDTELKGFILRIQPTGLKTYYCEYARGKREKLGRAPAVTPEQARTKCGKLLAGLTLGEQTPEEKRRRARAHTFKSYIENEYEPWATANRKSGAATVARLKATFYDELAKKKLPEITPWLIEKHRTKRRKAGKAPSTINRDMVALRAALTKAVEWNLLDEHPLKETKPLKIDKGGIVRYLTQDEEKRLRDALTARDRRLIQGRASGNEWRRKRGYDVMPDITGAYGDHLTPAVLLTLNTGLRRGELLALTWEAVNLKTKIVTLKAEHTKSETTRHLPLNQEAHDVLKSWGHQTKQEGLVFKARDGGKLDNMKKSWAGVLEAAAIEKFRWHDLRHHFASALVMAGADLNTVRELLGHSDIKMTLRYSHLAPEHRAAAVALLDGGR